MPRSLQTLAGLGGGVCMAVGPSACVPVPAMYVWWVLYIEGGQGVPCFTGAVTTVMASGIVGARLTVSAAPLSVGGTWAGHGVQGLHAWVAGEAHQTAWAGDTALNGMVSTPGLL